MSISKTLKKGDCWNVHKQAYSMFTIQSIFIILLIVVFSIFHSFFSTLMFSIMINMHIGIVRIIQLYSIFLLTISVFSVITCSMTVLDPDIIPIEKFILDIKSFSTEWYEYCSKWWVGFRCSHNTYIHRYLYQFI